MSLRFAPCLLLLTTGTLLAARARQAEPLAVHAALFSRGEHWVPGKSPFEQPGIQEHIRHNRELAERLVGAAPFEKDYQDPNDPTIGLVLLLAKDAAAAEEWAEADPVVQSGVMDVRVYRWNVDEVRSFVPKR